MRHREIDSVLGGRRRKRKEGKRREEGLRLKREGSEGDISSEHQRAEDAWDGRVHSVWKDVNRLLCRGDDGALRLMKVNEKEREMRAATKDALFSSGSYFDSRVALLEHRGNRTDHETSGTVFGVCDEGGGGGVWVILAMELI